MIDFVVGRVEERADSGGSRFSESSLERWFTVECGSPGMLKSMSSSLIARCVPNTWRPIVAARHLQRTALHSARISKRREKRWLTGNVGLSTAY